jgi:very-short-patch-repair endonuclease
MDEFEAAAAIHLELARRALLRHGGDCVVSHESAAVVSGLPVYRRSGQVQLTRTAGARRNGRVHVSVAPLQRGDVLRQDGVCLTAPARTALDIARRRGVLAGLVTADAVVARAVTRQGLRDRANGMCRWPGAVAARQVAELADGRSESPLESVVRARFVLCGLPHPDVQVRLYDGFDILGRVDFFWREFGVVGEADGRIRYSREGLWQEKLRQERLEDAGYVVLRWTWAQAHAPDEVFADRVRRALERGDPRRIEQLRSLNRTRTGA